VLERRGMEVLAVCTFFSGVGSITCGTHSFVTDVSTTDVRSGFPDLLIIGLSG
jgi:hypothetical protein